MHVDVVLQCRQFLTFSRIFIAIIIKLYLLFHTNDFKKSFTMSVITSKSTMLSILKTPNTLGPRTSFHRVHFQLPSDIKKIILEFKNGSSAREYENLVCTIRDSEISDSDLLLLISEAKNCMSLLNYNLRLFVQAIIMVKWMHRNNEVVKSYQEFINDLVSAHSCHTKLVVDQLVKLFINTEESDWEDNLPREILMNQFSNIHLILKNTLMTIPMSESLLMESIKHNFPYVSVAKHKQVSFLINLLKIIQYQPDIRLIILQVIIDKIILIDVQSPKEEIMQYEENADEILYEMDIDKIEKNKKQMKHPLAETLDNFMDIILQYIKNECYMNGRLNKSHCQQIYNDLLLVFENVILPTHACHHVQFIMFYICSFDTTIAQDFMKFLWKQLILPSVTPIIRQISVCYLSSFLARADYLGLGYLKNYLIKMSEWIHNYISHHDSASNFKGDYKQHSVFYSVCQAMFYLIAFRHQDLVNSAIKLKFLQSLNLPKIVLCRLNPLKFCLPTIVDNFAAVTRSWQLAYCYTIIENNARASMPIMGNEGQIIINPVLDVYFPFDPCLLIRTNSHISPLYREYISILSQELPRITERKQRLYSGTEDEDDFIEEESLTDHILSDES